MKVSDVQRAQALYELVGKYTGPKRMQAIVKDNSAVSISISKEAKALQEAAERANIEKERE